VAGLDPKGCGVRRAERPAPLGVTLLPRGTLDGPGAGGTRQGQAKRWLRYWHPGSCPPHLDEPASHASGRAAPGRASGSTGGLGNDKRRGGDDDDNHTQADDNDLRADRDGRNSTTELAFAGHHEEGENRQV
jgi:hypothetical protein